uniref:Uncharacterized protein n=1 Tax=Arion vulgaris TaxID=1028688 RepID=A0A0B6ZTU6_9EUPU
MVVYCCHCLNVRIFADKLEGKPKTGILATCPLGSSCESVELIDQGFQFSHKCLVHRVRDKDWTVYMCVPCCLRTHAVNLDARIMVVNSEMKKGQDAIQVIKKSPDFSPVFNLLLGTNDGRQKDSGGIQPQSYETLQKQLGDLQTVLSKYLKHEEDAMDSRIRDFEEQERIQFSKLKESAQLQKAKLINVLFHKSEGNQATDKNMSSVQGHAILTHSRSANEYGKEGVGHSGNGKQNIKMRASSPDVFAMDEFDIGEVDEDNENNAPTSRYETKMRSDKLKGSHVQQFGRIQQVHLDTTDEAESGHDEASYMSTSVPISMPAHALRRASYLDDDSEKSAQFDDIPRHMQALSESIQERDRYIFGDRPRQRVHTGEFTQVNFH